MRNLFIGVISTLLVSQVQAFCQIRSSDLTLKQDVLKIQKRFVLITPMQFVEIVPGSFNMGSSDRFDPAIASDNVLHPVTLTKGFQIQQTEVTQKQWFDVMGENPSFYKDKKFCPEDHISLNGVKMCPNNPVENIRWVDTQEFIKKMNSGQTEFTYRLPTEAEWEYAVRAGTQTYYFFGNDFRDQITDLNREDLCAGLYDWYTDDLLLKNSDKKTHPVGLKVPNPWGLYDVYGNVYELTNDWYIAIKTGDSSVDPVGASFDKNAVIYKVLRGKSSAFRTINEFLLSDRNIGFRLARTKN